MRPLLILRGFLDMVDDKDLRGCLGGVKLEPDLLLIDSAARWRCRWEAES